MDDLKERIQIAVEFLKDKQSFRVGGLKFGMDGKYDMYVVGWSQYLNLENITKNQALSELALVKKEFMRILDLSSELKDFIQDKNINYNLAFDYGMGSIGICSEKNGVLEWEIELKK